MSTNSLMNSRYCCFTTSWSLDFTTSKVKKLCLDAWKFFEGPASDLKGIWIVMRPSSTTYVINFLWTLASLEESPLLPRSEQGPVPLQLGRIGNNRHAHGTTLQCPPSRRLVCDSAARDQSSFRPELGPRSNPRQIAIERARLMEVFVC